MIDFGKFQFGQASAELESSLHPELLLEGFLDPWNVVDKALNGHAFLFLGYKGSGKSAIGEHLRLAAEKAYQLFVQHTFLSDFPYGNFSKIVTGDAEEESRFPSAWSWILLLSILDSLSKDAGAEAAGDGVFQNAVSALRSIGLLPADNLKNVVIASSKPKYKAKLPALFEIEIQGGIERAPDLQFLHIIDYLKKIVLSFRSQSKHILVVDGLDDILLQRDIQYRSLAALVLETWRLNTEFFRLGVPIKILILCRTELYERVPGPNKNKIRQDLSVELDWYHDPRKPFESKLVELVNKRARLVDPALKDIFVQYFPDELNWKPTLQFLLDHTRHTPRDFIQLLVHTQRFSKIGPLSPGQVRSGIREYSINYFLPEIRDELVGYVDRRTADALFKAIAMMKKRDFSFRDLCNVLNNQEGVTDTEITSCLESLFECSAIANVRRSASMKYFFTTKYRNRNSYFNPAENIVIHRGLWKALRLA